MEENLKSTDCLNASLSLQCRPSLYEFDRSTSSRHAYLGDDLEDVESGGKDLEAGETYRVPLLTLEGIVLCPGDLLPLNLKHAEERSLAQQAITAEQPLTGMIAVAGLHRHSFLRHSIHQVGCLAEVRQLRHHQDGSLVLICRGRSRVLLPPAASLHDISNVPVRLLGDEAPLHLPKEAAQGQSVWGPWAYRPFDAHRLAQSARKLLAAVAPEAPTFHGPPLQLSYWLVSNLPLDDATRQQLLEARTAAQRLLLELKLLRRMGTLRCRGCLGKVGHLRDVVQMSDEGVSGCFVNPHGVVHDIAMLSKVHGVALEGEPETRDSWFPGYAWTLAYCRRCWQHLGWRFTAAGFGLVPPVFWGLRRLAIQGGSLEGGGQEGGEEGSIGDAQEDSGSHSYSSRGQEDDGSEGDSGGDDDGGPPVLRRQGPGWRWWWLEG